MDVGGHRRILWLRPTSQPVNLIYRCRDAVLSLSLSLGCVSSWKSFPVDIFVLRDIYIYICVYIRDRCENYLLRTTLDLGRFRSIMQFYRVLSL